jgi:hypothetical protein
LKLYSPKSNIFFTWQSLKLLFWLSLILLTINLSTGAVIVLVASGPAGQSGDEVATMPAGEVRLLHLELFGGIIHLHLDNPNNSSSTSPSSASSFGGKQNQALQNAYLVRSFDVLFPRLSVNGPAPGPEPDFSPPKNNILTGERPGPAGLITGDKVITSSSSEPSLSRVYSSTFHDPEKVLMLFEFAQISHRMVVEVAAWPDIFPYPPEKPPIV